MDINPEDFKAESLWMPRFWSSTLISGAAGEFRVRQLPFEERREATGLGKADVLVCSKSLERVEAAGFHLCMVLLGTRFAAQEQQSTGKNHPDDSPEAFTYKSDEELSQETLDTWMRRLQPLHGREVFFVCADRVGAEPLSLLGHSTDLKNQFCGTSCAPWSTLFG